MKLLYIVIISAFLVSSCKNNRETYSPLSNNSSIHKVSVKEILQGGNYTFLLVIENKEEYWMAVSKTDTKVKDILYYKNALLMRDFESKELNKVFDKILFVDNISHSPQLLKSISKDTLDQKKKKNISEKSDIKVDPAPGGITIGELFKNKADYANKTVVIRGQVVKINKNIMDRNWVHLRDGTSHEGKSDLTFTSLEEVNVGDVITFKGTVALEKEYGAGYNYPIVVESATLK